MFSLLLHDTCGIQQISGAVETRGMTALLSLVIVTILNNMTH